MKNELRIKRNGFPFIYNCMIETETEITFKYDWIRD